MRGVIGGWPLLLFALICRFSVVCVSVCECVRVCACATLHFEPHFVTCCVDYMIDAESFCLLCFETDSQTDLRRSQKFFVCAFCYAQGWSW